jgi:hypothetical protein
MVFPVVGAGLMFCNVALKPRLLVFDKQFPALWTWRQDDELVMDNQGFWFHRRCEGLPECWASKPASNIKGKDCR